MNFLMPGVSRCGTTSIYEYLKKNDSYYLDSNKEPKYYSQFEINPRNGVGDFNLSKTIVKSKKEYFKRFESKKITGEASSDYFYYSDLLN